MTASGKPGAKLPSVLTIVKESFQVSFDLWSVLYGYTAWLFIPLLLSLTATIFLPTEYSQALKITADVIFILLGTWVSTAIILYTALHYVKEENESINLDRLSVRAWKRLAPVLLSNVVLTLATLLGLIFLIVPGIIIYTVFAFAPIASALTNRNLKQAFEHSYEIVKGQITSVMLKLFLGYLIFGGILWGLFVIAAQTLSVIIPASELRLAWFGVTANITEMALLPPLLIFHLILYFSLRKSYDLAQNTPAQTK